MNGLLCQWCIEWARLFCECMLVNLFEFAALHRTAMWLFHYTLTIFHVPYGWIVPYQLMEHSDGTGFWALTFKLQSYVFKSGSYPCFWDVFLNSYLLAKCPRSNDHRLKKQQQSVHVNSRVKIVNRVVIFSQDIFIYVLVLWKKTYTRNEL